MNDKFESQKGKLLSISQEIRLLRQQVNFLLRNEKPIGLLDLDVLMNRTHTIYDTLCAINLGNDVDEDDLELTPEALAELFGAAVPETSQEEDETPADETPRPLEEVPIVEETSMQEETPASDEVPLVVEVAVVEETSFVEESPATEKTPFVEDVPVVDSFPIKSEIAETNDFQEVKAPIESLENHQSTPELESVEEPIQEPVREPDATSAGDELGFFFRFEDVPPVEAEAVEPEVKLGQKPMETMVEEQPAAPVYVDDKWVHFVKEIPENQIPERDFVEADTIVRDNPYEMPKMDDTGFELTTHETLGEKMIRDDRSLAAKLQQNRILDLKSVIGINDKFLFVNELFGGSMEKYNKSIENLNDLKTLNGAMIYLNELKIELQWNNSNEAYTKLTDLVRRKFE